MHVLYSPIIQEKNKYIERASEPLPTMMMKKRVSQKEREKRLGM